MAKKIKYPVLVSVTPVFGVFFFLGAGGAQPSGPHLGPRSPPVPIQAHFVPFIGTGSTEQPGRGLYESWFSLFSRWEGDGNRKKKIYIYFFFFYVELLLGHEQRGKARKSPERALVVFGSSFPDPRVCSPALRAAVLPALQPAEVARSPRESCPPHPRSRISLPAPSLAAVSSGGKSQPLTLRDKLLAHIAKEGLRKQNGFPPQKKILKKQNPKFCAIYNRRVLDPTDCAGKGRRGKGVGFSLMNS